MAMRWTVKLTPWQRIIIKSLIHLVASGWLMLTFWLGVQDQLGADPVAGLLHFTGFGAINLLLITLLISPLSRYFGGELMRFRRLVGIYTFVYALGHFLTFAIFILGLDLNQLGTTIVERPYITIGFAALLILLALTITSPNTLRRKLGRRWQTLHNLIYPALILMLWHYTWSEKTAWGTPVYYWAGALGVVLIKTHMKWKSWLSFRRK